MARSISYQVGVLTLGRTIAYIAMFFVPIVNVRMLSMHDYGDYRQFWLLFETLSALFILSFPQSLLYFLPRADSKQEKNAFVTQTIMFLFVMGMLTSVVYAVLNITLRSDLGAVVDTYFWRLCYFTLFMMIARLMESLFVAERQVERQAVYQVITMILRALLVMLVSWQARSVNILIWAVCGYALSLFLFTIIYTGGVYRPSLKLVSLSSIKIQLSYSLPLGLAAIAMLLLTQTDKYIITSFMGSAAFAIYSVGAFQIPLSNIIMISVSNVTLPLMAQYQKEGRYSDIVDLWQRVTVKAAALFFPMFVFLEILARPVIVLLFAGKHPEYVEAAPVFSIYLFLFIRMSIETWSVLAVLKKTAFLFKVFLFGFALNLVLSIILYKRFGRLGVPISTAFVTYLVHTLNIIRISTVLKVHFFKILPWGKLVVLMLVAIAPGVLVWLVHRGYGVNTFSEITLAGVGYSIVYLFLIFILKLITWRDVKSLFGKS